MPYIIECGSCKGKGKKIDIAIGLGYKRLEPAYTEQVCPDCGGSGKIRIEDVGIKLDLDQPSSIPNSFIDHFRERAKKSKVKKS